MTTFTLPSLPAPLAWLNEPIESRVHGPQALTVVAGPATDWFVDPARPQPITNAPVAYFRPADAACILSARVTVAFAATYDAGVLLAYVNESQWAKLCFEYSPGGQPTIVTVVTRGVSDDCNSVALDDHSVFLRIFRRAGVFAFHYSTGGRLWHLARYFALEDAADLRLGFSVQSPTGSGCRVDFTEIEYRAGVVDDIRNGS